MKITSYFVSWVMVLNLVGVNNYAIADDDEYVPPIDAVADCLPGVTCGVDVPNDAFGGNIDCIVEDEDEERELTESEADMNIMRKCFKDNRNLKVEKANESLEDDHENRYLTRMDLHLKYNLELTGDRPASDFKTCSFNSFNDEYRSASNSERRAELIIRAFEYVHSGKGTIDYWLDSRGISLFERMNKIAKRIREYRKKVIDKHLQTNEIMKCKCIASFGVNKFPDEEPFYTQSCAAHTTGMNTDLLATGNIASTTGDASGIAQEKLLLEYLNLRMAAQVNKFDTFTKIAEDISELVEYINEIKWEQSWDTPMFLYKYDVVRLNSESRAASEFFGGPFSSIGWSDYDGRMEKLEEDIVSNEVMKPFAVGSSGIKTLGNYMTATENEYTEWSTDRLRYADKDWKVSRRYYVGPYYDNTKSEEVEIDDSVTVPENKICRVQASSRACVRNIHSVVYKFDEENETRFLLDAKLPEFVKETSFTQDSEFIKKINDAYIVGTNQMKANIPDKKHGKQKLHYQDELKDAYFKNIKKDTDLARLFQPGGADWPKTFSAKSNIIAGVKEYAKCTKLKECGAKYLDEGEQDVYGFGYYMSAPADLNAFAEYVYEQHYLWPSLSAYSEMGYPTMAQTGYIENIAYSLNLLALASADRSMDLGDTFDHYESDWNKRISDYESTNGVKDGRVRGVNAAYSKEFRAEFIRLNFEAGGNLGKTYDNDGKMKKSKNSGFSSSELDALQSAAKNAIKNNKLLKEKPDPTATVAENIYRQAKLDLKKASLAAAKSGTKSRRGAFKSSKSPLAAAGITSKSKKKKTHKYEKSKKRERKSLSLKKRKKKKKKSSSSKVSRSSIKHSTDATRLFESIDRHSKVLNPVDSDSLFQVVTKAYKRNLYRMFKKNKVIGEGLNDIQFNKTRTIKDSKKDELKGLLGD